MNAVLVGILLYVILQLIIGFLVSRTIRSEEDYLLAGRRLGYGLATFSIFATWFGAEACIGSAGEAYAEGPGGISSEPFGYGMCLLLMGSLFAARLWKMKLTTVADLFRQRYSPGTERIVAILMIPTSVLWAAAQIRAFGLVLSTSSDLSVSIAVTIAAAVVVTYTVLGGLLADTITDLIQGLILIIGLTILFVVTIDDIGGISAFVSTIRTTASEPDIQQSSRWGFLETAEAWAIPICGSLFAQELVSRVLASRTSTIARRSSHIAGILYISVGLIPLSLGLIGSGLITDLDHSEQILPRLAQLYLPAILYTVFAGALVSAILSTVDSTLLAASGLLVHNIVLPLGPRLPDRRKLRLQRAGVVLMGVLAYLLAMYAEGVYNLVKDASSFGSAGIVVALLFGMFTSYGGTKSAMASLVAGSVVWIVAHYIFEFDLSYLLSLFSAVLAYMVWAPFDRMTPSPVGLADPQMALQE